MLKFDPDTRAIIMCGISGAGKTHYALKLEKEGFIRLSCDNLIWERAGRDLCNLSKNKQKHLFAECRTEILHDLANLLDTGKKVVVDATNCKRSIRDEIRNLCAERNVNPIFLYCTAEKEELWNRLSQRKGESSDDLIVSRQQFLEYWDGFERPQDTENDFIFLDQ